MLTFKNADNKALPQIIFRNDIDAMERKIKDLLQAHPEFEVYNIMNALFEETIPQGYIFKVSQIVKSCAELM